jgi:hypothetical protein
MQQEISQHARVIKDKKGGGKIPAALDELGQ